MPTSFPTGLDTFVNPAAVQPQNSPSHSQQHTNINDAMAAVQAKLGINGSAVTSSLDYLLKNAGSVDPGHLHTIAAVSGLQAALDGKAALSHTHTLSAITDFPSQTGNSGKFLTTNGSVTSWGTVSGMAIGNAVTSVTSGSVLYADGSGQLAQRNPGFTYDGSTLALRVSGSANIQEWQGSTGTALVSVQGLNSNTCGQITINVGGGGPVTLGLWASNGAGWLLSGNGASIAGYNNAFQMDGASGDARLVLNNSGLTFSRPNSGWTALTLPGDGGMVLQNRLTSTIGLSIKLPSSQAVSAVEVRDSSDNILSRFDKNGYFMTRKTSAPADGDVATSEVALWLDNTNGAGKLMVKAKTANGTVVTGSVTLS